MRSLLVALALVTGFTPAALAAGLLGSTGPIDRRFNTIGVFCQSTNAAPGTPGEYASVPFVADGPEVTIVIRTHNYYDGLWREPAVDNLTLVTESTWQTYFDGQGGCTGCSAEFDGFFRFDLVPSGEFVYFEQFDAGPAGWSTGDGAYFRPESAPRDLVDFGQPCTPDLSGGSLGIGLNNTTEWTESYRTIDGLTPGESYRFGYWWHAYGELGVAVDGDLQVDVLGTDPWEAAPGPMLDNDEYTRAIAWGDANGDGRDDLYLGYYDNTFANRLFLNDGGGAFTEWATALSVPSLSGAATWGDYDQDGDQDLFTGRLSQPDQLFRNDGALTFTPLAMPADAANPIGAGWADYDGDRDLELLVGDFTGPTDFLFRNDGGDSFFPLTNAAFSTTGAIWGDYDADLDQDLYLTYYDGANVLLRNDGGSFGIPATGPWADPLPTLTAGFFDYDGDLDLDLFVLNEGGDHSLLRNDGGDDFVEVSVGLGNVPFSYAFSAEDFDNDGDVDVLMGVLPAGSRHFRNDGGTFVDIARGPFPLAQHQQAIGLAAYDYDQDGQIDCYLAGAGSANDTLLRNRADNGNHWLQLRLEGSGASNRDALGAQVFVSAGGQLQMREVHGSTNFASQSSRVVHFGLGGASTIDYVQVVWPSGHVQTRTDLAVDQRTHWIESSSTSVDDPRVAPAALSLLPGRPSPLRDRTTLGWSLPRAAEATLRIYDVTGRLVRELVSGRLEAGAQTTVWDARDSNGRRVAAGVYFAQLRAGAEIAHQKLVVLR